MMHEDQTKKLYQAITDIDDQWVEEAQSEELSSVKIITGKPKRNWASIAVAACAVLAFGGGLLFLHSRLGPEKPPVGTSVDSAETTSNTLQSTTTTTDETTTTTTTTQPLTEEEREVHALCEQLAQTFFYMAAEDYSDMAFPNLCDHVNNDRFAAWLHYRVYARDISPGEILSMEYTPEEMRSEGDFRFVTATIEVEIKYPGGFYQQKAYRQQRFVLSVKDGIYTIVDWYDDSGDSSDTKLRGAYSDEVFRDYWSQEASYRNVADVLGWNTANAYALPDMTEVSEFRISPQADESLFGFTEEENARLRDALSKLQCTPEREHDFTRSTTGWNIAPYQSSGDAPWVLFVGMNGTICYSVHDEDEGIHQEAYLFDYSGALQELIKVILDLTQYERLGTGMLSEPVLISPADETTYIDLPDEDAAKELLLGMRLLPCSNAFADAADPIAFALGDRGESPFYETFYVDSKGRIYMSNGYLGEDIDYVGKDDEGDGWSCYQDQTDNAIAFYNMLKQLSETVE